MSQLYVKQIPVGPMKNFAYAFGDLETKEVLLMDPAWEVEKIVRLVESDGMTIKGALITHYHPDHCGGHIWGHDVEGVKELKELRDVPLYVHEKDKEGVLTVTGMGQSDLISTTNQTVLRVGSVELTCLHTPGHTPGSQCILCRGHLVSGDTLFLTGCGRVDLPGGNGEHLYQSLQKIKELPQTTLILPGHSYDPESQLPLSAVSQKNPYLMAPDEKSWRKVRGLD